MSVEEEDKRAQSREHARARPKVLSHSEMILQMLEIVRNLTRDKRSPDVENIVNRRNESGARWPPLLGPRPEFSGTHELGKFLHVESFIRDLEFCMSGEAWTDCQKVESGMLSLKGDVLNYMKSLDHSERNTWCKFKQVLRTQFTVSPGKLAQLEGAFNPRKSESEEPRSFIFRVRNVLNELDPFNVKRHEVKLHKFKEIMMCEVPRDMRSLLMSLTALDNASMERLADAWDAFIRVGEQFYASPVSGSVNAAQSGARRNSEKSTQRGGYRGRSGHGWGMGSSGRRPEEDDIFCFKCRKVGHYAGDCRNYTVCNYCRRVGHVLAKCWKRRSILSKNVRGRGMSTTRGWGGGMPPTGLTGMSAPVTHPQEDHTVHLPPNQHMKELGRCLH